MLILIVPLIFTGNDANRINSGITIARQNDIKSMTDMQLQMLEQEVADREAQLADRKAEIEAESEAVSAELESVKQAISTEIKNSTIQLK